MKLAQGVVDHSRTSLASDENGSLSGVKETNEQVLQVKIIGQDRRADGQTGRRTGRLGGLSISPPSRDKREFRETARDGTGADAQNLNCFSCVAATKTNWNREFRLGLINFLNAIQLGPTRRDATASRRKGKSR